MCAVARVTKRFCGSGSHMTSTIGAVICLPGPGPGRAGPESDCAASSARQTYRGDTHKCRRAESKRSPPCSHSSSPGGSDTAHTTNTPQTHTNTHKTPETLEHVDRRDPLAALLQSRITAVRWHERNFPSIRQTSNETDGLNRLQLRSKLS